MDNTDTFGHIHLQWFAEPDVQPDGATPTPEQGATVESPVTPTGEQGAEPFYTYKGVDGKETVYKTRDDLTRDFANRGLMQSDYTKKMQEFSSARKQWDTEKADYEKRLNDPAFQETMRYHSFLQGNPAIRDRLAREMNSPQGRSNNQNAAFMSELSKINERFDTMERERQEREDREQYNSRRDAAVKALSTKYGDFDADAVNNFMDSVYNVPEENQVERLLEMGYMASKYMPPAALENAQASSNGTQKAVTGAGKAKIKQGKKEITSIADGMEALKNDPRFQ